MSAVPLGLEVVPGKWVGLLGLVPFVLGVTGRVRAIRARGTAEPAGPAVATGFVSVAGVTIANGGDNICVHTPLFRTIGLSRSRVAVVVFAVGVTAWCRTGSWLGSHKAVIAVVRQFVQWVVPGVFVTIGAVAVIESGVVARMATLWPRGQTADSSDHRNAAKHAGR